MEEVRIVTDSAASLPEPLKLKYGISAVPIWVQVGDESYKEGVDIDHDTFYKTLDGKIMPKTSSPAPADFLDTYRRLAQKAKEIISIHVAGNLSATCQVAKVAAEEVQEEVDVHVYDSKTVSMATGFLVLEAARSAMQGLRKDEILARLDSMRNRMCALAAIPTLKYLYRSGRVSQGQAMLASLLSIKPVIEIKDGVVAVVDQVRTFHKALARVIELAQRRVGNAPSVAAVMHANAPKEALAFAEQVKARINIRELLIGEVGPVLATHGGPGIVGIALYPANG